MLASTSQLNLLEKKSFRFKELLHIWGVVKRILMGEYWGKAGVGTEIKNMAKWNYRTTGGSVNVSTDG